MPTAAATSATLARQQFAQRLQQSLDRYDFGDSATRLAEAFNRRSPADVMTTHGVRKWLKGESIPTQPRILVLAEWLHVDPAWLRFGDTVGKAPDGALVAGEVTSLESDIALLRPDERLVVKALIEVIFKARAIRGQT